MSDLIKKLHAGVVYQSDSNCITNADNLMREAADALVTAGALTDNLGGQVSKLTVLLDKQLGTPCEQIRHQQELEQQATLIAKARDEALEEAYKEVEYSRDLFDALLAITDLKGKTND